MKKLTRAQKIFREIKSIAIICFLVFAFRSSFFEPFRIPSGSMIPSLMIGDFILVNKFSYGFKIPYSDMFTDPVYITDFTPPKRGDVIVFKYPKDPDINYIKRVVGLPGDKIQLIDNMLYINDEPIKLKKITGKKIMDDMDDKFKHFEFDFYEARTGKHIHAIQLAVNSPSITDTPPINVPKDKYFVMGDNRDFSADSRFWGFVSKEHIKGKALFVWFSMILPFSDHPFKIRLKRIGTVIDEYLRS